MEEENTRSVSLLLAVGRCRLVEIRSKLQLQVCVFVVIVIIDGCGSGDQYR